MTPSAVGQWVEAYAARLYRDAVLLASEAEAADLCQEVFLIAAHREADYAGRSKVYTWLYGILRNLVRDRHSRRARRSRINARLQPNSQPQMALGPEEAATAQQNRGRVHTAISALPDHQRTVVRLFYLEELSIAEVAASANLPVGTVKSRLFQARRHLKQALREER